MASCQKILNILHCRLNLEKNQHWLYDGRMEYNLCKISGQFLNHFHCTNPSILLSIFWRWLSFTELIVWQPDKTSMVYVWWQIIFVRSKRKVSIFISGQLLHYTNCRVQCIYDMIERLLLDYLAIWLIVNAFELLVNELLLLS